MFFNSYQFCWCYRTYNLQEAGKCSDPNYLKTIDFQNFIEKETKVSISFFINAQNEVIVVSTNNKDLDAVVKSTLNYKKIAVNELEYNKVYTVPVVIK